MICRSTLPVRLAELAAEDPDRRLLVDLESGETLSRGQVHEAVTSWAGALASHGVAPGDTVLTMQPTGSTAVATWLGVGWLRALEVPVNTQFRGEMLSYVVNDSGARVMVIHQQYIEQLMGVLDVCPSLQLAVVVGGPAEPKQVGHLQLVDSEDFLRTAVDATSLVSALPEPQLHDVAAIVYTSGTTGRSKGVVVPWGQLQTTASWSPAPAAGMSADDVAYVPFPFYHVSVRSPVANMIMLGGAIVIRERFSTSYFWEDVRAHGCTYGQILAGMTQLLLAEPPRADDADNPLRIMNMVPVATNYREFEDRFGVRVGTLFTMTEISVPFVSLEWSIRTPAACGELRPGCDVRLVDEFDAEVPEGQPGELIVRTDEPWTLNSGYWNKPEETAAAWRNGWFHTGDLFRRDAQGSYYFVDRNKDAIRRRGENISSAEVESLVLSHPGVLEVAAIGVRSERDDLGFTDEEVKVVVVPKQGVELDPAELVEFLEPRMPRFMVPRYVEVVTELPKTPTFKIRKVELREAPLNTNTWDRAARA